MQQELITALGPNDPDDGDQGRRQRGLAIAHLHQHNIMPDRYGYRVPSQSGNGAYVVNVEPGLLYCDCADFQERQKPCKHVYAVLGRSSATRRAAVGGPAGAARAARRRQDVEPSAVAGSTTPRRSTKETCSPGCCATCATPWSNRPRR